MSKSTTQLMKRYVCILNITHSNRYISADDVRRHLKERYGVEGCIRIVQRDLKCLFDIGAVEKKGNNPIGWRSSGIEGFGEKMLNFKLGESE